MAGAQREADELRRQMEQVRGEFDENVDEFVAGARRLTDWRSYVRGAPYGALAAATALGFLIVPRRLQVNRPRGEDLEEYAKRHQFVVADGKKPKAPSEKTGKEGTVNKLVSMLANAAVRAAVGYASQRAGGLFREHEAAQDEPAQSSPFATEARSP